MASRDLDSWMWLDSLRMLDRADRLQRHFFQPGAPRPPQWEPPVDVFETRDAIWVIIALPGVAAEHITIEVADRTLVVSGERQVPAPARTGLLHRLEIPHGRFERRLALPYPRLRIARHELLDGCLYLQLRKAKSPESIHTQVAR